MDFAAQEREADQERRERQQERDERFYEHPIRRGFIYQGEWRAIDERYEELFDAAGVPKSTTWDNEHDYLEDVDACLKGLAEVMHTPQEVARHPAILFLDWVWRWDAVDGVFRGRRKRHFDKEGTNANHQG